MAKGVLKIATCQFAVSASVRRNSTQIQRFLQKAKSSGVDIVHFSECALSGYVGTDFATFDGYDWEMLKAETDNGPRGQIETLDCFRQYAQIDPR